MTNSPHEFLRLNHLPITSSDAPQLEFGLSDYYNQIFRFSKNTNSLPWGTTRSKLDPTP